MKGENNMPNTNPHNFKHALYIPVTIGEKIWTFWTDCCNVCFFQPRENKPIKCDMFAPCHTFIHSIQAVELKYSNLGDVLSLWNKKYFFTEDEARAAAERLVKENIIKIRELGYRVNDEGYAEKDCGWEEELYVE